MSKEKHTRKIQPLKILIPDNIELVQKDLNKINAKGYNSPWKFKLWVYMHQIIQ